MTSLKDKSRPHFIIKNNGKRKAKRRIFGGRGIMDFGIGIMIMLALIGYTIDLKLSKIIDLLNKNDAKCVEDEK